MLQCVPVALRRVDQDGWNLTSPFSPPNIPSGLFNRFHRILDTTDQYHHGDDITSPNLTKLNLIRWLDSQSLILLPRGSCLNANSTNLSIAQDSDVRMDRSQSVERITKDRQWNPRPAAGGKELRVIPVDSGNGGG